MLKVVILCAMGMSSSVIVKAVQKAAAEKGIDIDIHCQASLNFTDQDFNAVDVVLLAPQIRGQAEDVTHHLEGYNVAVGEIGMYEYALAKGDVVLESILKLSEEKK